MRSALLPLLPLLLACARPEPSTTTSPSSSPPAPLSATPSPLLSSPAPAPEPAPAPAPAPAPLPSSSSPLPSSSSPSASPPPLDVFDLHVDLGWQMHKHHADIRSPSRQASFDRLRRGQTRTLVLPLFIERGHTRSTADAQAEYLATFSALTQGLSRASAELGLRTMLSFEGADGFAQDHAAALAWVSRGACLWGLVHSRSNALGGASQDPDPAKRSLGLSTEGKSLAQALITHGALLDAAHAGDATLEDLAAIAEQRGAPLVDSHTGVRALANIPRNVSDAHIRRIARTGGIVGVSLHTGHLSESARKPVSLADYAAHILHVKQLVGIAHVAIGSDLEGDITLPAGVDGAAVWPALATVLRDAGLSDADLRALFHANAERVFAWSKAHGCVPQGVP